MAAKYLIVPHYQKCGIRLATAGYQCSLPTYGIRNTVLAIAAAIECMIFTHTLITIEDI